MPGNIEAFLNMVREDGRSEETVKNYGRNLGHFRDWLGEDKVIRRGTIDAWRSHMLAAGRSPYTVNARISTANSFVSKLGHRELQALKQVKQEKALVPELKREEYIRLLQAAKTLEDDDAYYLIRLFGETGVRVGELGDVTPRVLKEGVLREGERIIRFPAALRRDLLAYVERLGLEDDRFFLGVEGPPGRSTINWRIKQVAMLSGVPLEKCNPKCLRQMYDRTYAQLLENVTVFVNQAYDRLLEEEQIRMAAPAP